MSDERQPPTPADTTTTEERQPPTPKEDAADLVPRAEVEKMRAGFEARIKELTTKNRELSEALPDLDAIDAKHAEALKALEDQLAAAKSAEVQARQDLTFVRHGIEDDEARDFVLYKYDQAVKAAEEGQDPPDFAEWARGYVASDPVWLRPYLSQHTVANTSDPGDLKAPEPSPVEAAPAEPAPAEPKPKAPAPAKDQGAAPVGSKGQPSLSEMAAWDRSTYRAYRASLLGDG